MEANTNEGKSTELFRAEAMRFQATRLEGEVLVGMSSPWLMLGWVTSALVALVVGTAYFADYSRKEQVRGRLVLSEGTVPLSADQPAVVREIRVAPGEAVKAGQTLIRVENATSAGEPVSMFITAPADATVGAIPVNIGQSVATGETAVELIPSRSRLEADLYIPSRSAAFIKPGQRVSLRYDAFFHRRFGAGVGTVQSVSLLPVATSDSSASGSPGTESIYKAKVLLESERMNAYGEAVPLRPGMDLTAEIVVGTRSIFQWLFDPIYAAGQRR